MLLGPDPKANLLLVRKATENCGRTVRPSMSSYGRLQRRGITDRFFPDWYVTTLYVLHLHPPFPVLVFVH